MSVSDIVTKVIGIVLAVFGLITMLTSVKGLPATWIIVLVGLGCLALGIYLIKGGSFSI